MLVYQRVMSENPLTGRFIAREHQTSQACLSTWRTFPGFKRICELLSTPWMGKIRSSLMGVDHGEPSTLGFYHQNSQTKLGYNYYQLYIYIYFIQEIMDGSWLVGFHWLVSWGSRITPAGACGISSLGASGIRLTAHQTLMRHGRNLNHWSLTSLDFSNWS